ncbi:MarC family protein [Fundidesulfovibrio terrae]|uniref:MarC family protein n=1 Tax=Fundidesulfovibrio terrae TaxID=2922866 RepID=UPI001FAF2EFE|nr:MarC family protein [Fundidesulfovibrio terrae]
MNDFSNTFLLVYAALFPIVNPVGNAPIFLGLTIDSTEADRRALARRVGVNCFFLLLCALFVGSHVLEFFGISLPILRIAGGSVVTAFGWKLLHAGEHLKDHKTPEATGMAVSMADAFYPLTLPLTVGPGSLSVAITLGSRRPITLVDLPHIAVLGSAAVLGLAAIAATVYVSYRYARQIVAALGDTGTNVMLRLSAFILLCIGLEIVWTGYRELMGIAH